MFEVPSSIPVRNAGSTKNSQTLNTKPQIHMMIVVNPFNELYLKNLDIPEGRTIYLSRHGESEYNVDDRIGGDSSLTERG